MKIAFSCPQCGAEVDLAEEDTVFRCLYCGSTLKPTGRNEVQSFFVAPRHTTEKVGKALFKALKTKTPKELRITEHRLLYAPYWRVNGMIFQWSFMRKYFKTARGDKSWEDLKKLRATPWIHTFPAFDSRKWGLSSLGLRVQVLKIYPFNKEKLGNNSYIFKQTVLLEEAVGHARKSITKQGLQKSIRVDISISELIGERYSLLYFPFHCYTVSGNGPASILIVDAFSQKVIKGEVDIDELRSDSPEEKIPYRPLGFIPFACPNCGWDFIFRPKNTIHFCGSCARAWMEKEGEYLPVPYRLVSRESSPNVILRYLCFWKLTVIIKTPDREYQTVKDFTDLFPLPRVLDQEMLKSRSISFYIPAFKIKDVALVDKFASRLTRAQPAFPESEPDSIEDLDRTDVWLPLSEAKEMAYVLLYSMTKEHHKNTKAVVKKAELQFPDTTLLCIPFMDQGIYLRETQTDLALQKNALDLG